MVNIRDDPPCNCVWHLRVEDFFVSPENLQGSMRQLCAVPIKRKHTSMTAVCCIHGNICVMKLSTVDACQFAHIGTSHKSMLCHLPGSQLLPSFSKGKNVWRSKFGFRESKFDSKLEYGFDSVGSGSDAVLWDTTLFRASNRTSQLMMDGGRTNSWSFEKQTELSEIMESAPLKILTRIVPHLKLWVK